MAAGIFGVGKCLFIKSAYALEAEMFKSVTLSFTGGAHANPYTEVDMHAVFTGPSGQSLKVYSYWDGGDAWRIRFAPTAAGRWTYRTVASGDSRLNGITGEMSATDTGLKGFLTRDPANKFAFKRSRGENVFLMGDTCWNCMSNVGGKLNYSTYTQFINERSFQKFNFLRSYIVSFQTPLDGTDTALTNEGGRSFDPWDPDKINPAFFREVDRRVEYANSKQITPHLLFGSDGTNLTQFFGWGNGKMDRYVRYAVARYGAYDVAWEGRAEFEEQETTTPGAENLANQIGNWVKLYDPYNHIRSMHTLETNNELASQPWLDWIMHQSRDWNLIKTDRGLGKPVMNEEFYYENSGAGSTHDHHTDAETVRRGAWKVMVSGATGLAYGNTGTYNSRSKPFVGISYANSPGAAYMTHLFNFWNGLGFSNLSPASIIISGQALAISDPGNEYVVYAENGGSFTINLFATSGQFLVEWYNPRNGERISQSAISGGGNRNFASPGTGDWALHLTRSSGSSDTTAPSSPAGFSVR